MRRARIAGIAPILGLVVACSGGGSKDTGGSVTDAGAGDTGPVIDAGGMCNPYDGTGCSGSNTCVWHANGDMLQCQNVGMAPKAFEQICDQAAQPCQSGLTCLAIRTATTPKCYRVCDTQTGMGCANLTGANAGYRCSGLAAPGGGGMEMYGICTGATPCDPVMDTCPMGQTCAPQGNNTFCAPSGSTQLGGDCSMGACVKGLVCIPLRATSGPVCYAPCDPNKAMPCTGMNDECLALTAVTYGICKAPIRACDPLHDMCAMGQNCTLQNTDLMCAPDGTTAIGGDCTTASCVHGGVCVLVQGKPTPICFTPCDPRMPASSGCPMTMTCSSIGEPFGICT